MPKRDNVPDSKDHREKKKRAKILDQDFEPKDQSRWFSLLFLLLFILIGYFFWVQ